MPVLAENRQVRRDYEILDVIEAGLVLRGFEVRAVKTGRMSLQGAFVTLRAEEPYLVNASIAPYQPRNTPAGYDPAHPRKLLLRRDQIKTLIGRRQERGLTIVPLKVYTKHGKIKIEIGVGRGKRRYDRREELRRREAEREMLRAMK